MIWFVIGIFLVGPLLAIPFAMAAGKMAPAPEGNLAETIEFDDGLYMARESGRELVEQPITVE
jgi:hypothetical protein